jgi:4-carboxymuconolactone decarboxylase
MRLPLIVPADLTDEQRPMYDAFTSMVKAKEYQGFEVRNREGAFIGPWAVFLQFPQLSKPLIEFINLAQKLPGLSERARQVVILTIGGHFNVAYELYAHAPLAQRAGLRPDQVAALSAGARPVDLSEDERLAADVTAALVQGSGPVPGPLYETAVDKLGREGFAAIVFITIHYLALGAMLNGYDVPAGRPVSQLEEAERS